MPNFLKQGGNEPWEAPATTAKKPLAPEDLRLRRSVIKLLGLQGRKIDLTSVTVAILKNRGEDGALSRIVLMEQVDALQRLLEDLGEMEIAARFALAGMRKNIRERSAATLEAKTNHPAAIDGLAAIQARIKNHLASAGASPAQEPQTIPPRNETKLN